MKRYITIAWSIFCLIFTIHDWSSMGSYILAVTVPAWVVGMIVIIIISKAFGSSKNEQLNIQNNDSEETKTCPKCAEVVKKQAQLCRFCSFEFSE